MLNEFDMELVAANGLGWGRIGASYENKRLSVARMRLGMRGRWGNFLLPPRQGENRGNSLALGGSVMQSKRPPILYVAAFTVVFGFLIAAAPLLAATKEKVLYRFSDNNEKGYYPSGSLVSDAAGNLYGVTTANRVNGDAGAVFELERGTDGKWTERDLYRFCRRAGCIDGYFPAAGLVFDASGTLYGTTLEGGDYDWGTVFELALGPNGRWTEKVLHSFDYSLDGFWPSASLIFDAAGNLYGTTAGCGIYYCGTVFQLSPDANDNWKENVLHRFSGSDGAYPYANLIFDGSGNLYSTTSEGGGTGCGGAGCGTVFQLQPSASGKWREKVLHRFRRSDGAGPFSGLIFDASWNLYGTTAWGGGVGCGYDQLCGTIFQLTPGANGKWREKVLHRFRGGDGAEPGAGLIFDAGNLYGTTVLRGGHTDYGTAFELTLSNKDKWTEKVLHIFRGSDGAEPGALFFDAAGNLYGVTMYGGGSGCGDNGCGTVFEITP
jgi:uncharacterized repeat protein (TIGR03803 family)